MTVTTYRETKYCNAIRRVIRLIGHPTNNELLLALRREYPELSATTVHRATTRLVERGEIGVAPPSARGAARFDALAMPHDHFNCSICDRLCDASIRNTVLPAIKTAATDCSVVGSVLVTGICKGCSIEN